MKKPKSFEEFVEAILAGEIWASYDGGGNWIPDVYGKGNSLGFIHTEYQRYINGDDSNFHLHIGKDRPEVKPKEGQWVKVIRPNGMIEILKFRTQFDPWTDYTLLTQDELDVLGLSNEESE